MSGSLRIGIMHRHSNFGSICGVDRHFRSSLARLGSSGVGPKFARGGLRVEGTGLTSGASRPVAQVTRRGMRCRAKRKMSWAGHDVGRCTRIIVFISTTRAAILMRRRRSVSN